MLLHALHAGADGDGGQEEVGNHECDGEGTVFAAAKWNALSGASWSWSAGISSSGSASLLRSPIIERGRRSVAYLRYLLAGV